MSAFPTKRASELEERPEIRRWLIELLWADEAVGVLGGEPKSKKSFLALDVAVSVASGTPCLRRFPSPRKGNVLLFAAEDALHVVRKRLAGIAAAAGVDFRNLPIDVITAPTVRLDLPDHQRKLRETVEQLRPRLLVLDPFVRLHRKDENVAAEVAPLLAYLRELQRLYQTAVLLVHHARKGAAHARAGQALRGSSELHAWGDSNLYLRQKGDDELILTVEHRAAPSQGDLRLTLREAGDALALHVLDDPSPPGESPSPTLADRIEHALATATMSLTLRQLRDTCKVRNERLCKALASLTASGRIRKVDGGAYALVSASASHPPLHSSGSGIGNQRTT
jgi:hypothetical protein